MLIRILAVTGFLMVAPSVEAAFRAGVAVRKVTPDPLLPVSGGMGPSKPTTQKHGELTVRALVLESGETRVAVVSADFLGFPAVLGNRVRQRVATIPGDCILIGATHTHSAPDLYAFPDSNGSTSADLDYIDDIVIKTSEAILEAVQSLQPAQIKIAVGEARGKIAYNYYAPDLYDPRVNVLQLIGENGKAIATLINYAIHPEVIGSGRGICSPDLIGPLCDRVTELGGGTGIFMNSAQGGMVTADNRLPGGGEANDWSECQRIGRLLAEESLRIVADAQTQFDPKLLVAAKTVRFEVESPVMLAVLRGSPLGYSTDTEGRVATTINLINIGTAQIITIPGEALPNIGYYLKRKMRGQENFLFGLTNDAFGYILTSVDWGSFKRYEYVTRTCLGEATGDHLISECLALIATQSPPINK